MTRSKAEWIDKANSYAAAWKSVFGVDPSTPNVALGLSVAEHETNCGDAWPGDHNWGACTKGALSAAQHAALIAAGCHAAILRQPARTALEQQATQALVAAGLAPAPDQAIHVDSSPAAGAYFTFFGHFDDDEAGAAYFVQVLAKQRASCKAVLEGSTGPTDGGCYSLAAGMYRSHYYTGFHDPHAPGGDEANIDAYASSLSAIRPGVYVMLADWTPGQDVPAYSEPAPSGDYQEGADLLKLANDIDQGKEGLP